MNKDNKKAVILMVDDNSQNLKVAGNILKKNGYTTAAAKSGRQALQFVNLEKPDLILLDIMMPEMDGYQVCTHLKANSETADIPIIFLSASVAVKDEAYGLELGAVDYISKPISSPRLLARVKTHLALKYARENLEKQNEILAENVRLREDVDRITHHDLKTPLSGIIGFPEAIKLSGDTNEEQNEMLDMIEESGYRMLNMINLSLDLYKMETGNYQFNPTDADILKVVKHILKELDDHIKNMNLAVKLRVHEKEAGEQDTFYIRGDELLCHSMLANLMINAVEASPRGGTLTMEMIDAGNAVIRIHNESAVPEDIRETFFEKYSTSGKSRGTGLGTYSARLIAETQGGKISLQTSEETGTTITIELLKA